MAIPNRNQGFLFSLSQVASACIGISSPMPEGLSHEEIQHEDSPAGSARYMSPMSQTSMGKNDEPSIRCSEDFPSDLRLALCYRNRHPFLRCEFLFAGGVSGSMRKIV